MAPRRRRPAQPLYRRYAVGMGIFLLACVALALVLLLSERAPAARSAQATAPVPTATTTTAPTASGPLPTAAPTAPPTDLPLRVTVTPLEPNYTVQQGDTLGAIARRFGTTVEALQALNHLQDRSTLSIGQKLIVPEGSGG